MRLMTADPDRIGRLERQVAYLLQHLGIDPEVAAGQPAGSTFGSPELLDAIQRGKLINAIKIYRELTGASLSQAKSAVEKIARGGQP
jgi:ribosomal protein L7/L12